MKHHARGAGRAEGYIQYGSGMYGHAGWRNFDASPTLRYERLPVVGRLYTKNATRFASNVEYGDIVRGLPLPQGSCLGIYASHVLEHLALSDVRRALRHTRELLAPQGRFRMVVPDLMHLARRYLDQPGPDAASRFMRESGLGLEQRPRTLAGLIKHWLGNSQHLWMWDEEGLTKELSDAGFTHVRRAQRGDSEDPHFSDIEDPERWHNCLGLEAMR